MPVRDPAAEFQAFEHSGWERAARDYDDAWSRLTLQAIGPLLDATGVREGTRVLDVAAGPGYAAAAAAARGAIATGMDFSPAMVELARSRNPHIDFREGDAAALPFPEACFDSVLMNFGMLHLARPERAVAEAFRVLAPGGRYAFTVWAPPDAAMGFGIILEAVRSHGDPNVPIPPGPPFFRFSEAVECEHVLHAAGFEELSVAQHPQEWTFATPDDLFAAFHAGTVRTQALLRAQTPERLRRIRTAVRETAERLSGDGRLRIPMPAVLAAATKPRK